MEVGLFRYPFSVVCFQGAAACCLFPVAYCLFLSLNRCAGLRSWLVVGLGPAGEGFLDVLVGA